MAEGAQYVEFVAGGVLAEVPGSWANGPIDDPQVDRRAGLLGTTEVRQSVGGIDQDGRVVGQACDADRSAEHGACQTRIVQVEVTAGKLNELAGLGVTERHGGAADELHYQAEMVPAEGGLVNDTGSELSAVGLSGLWPGVYYHIDAILTRRWLPVSKKSYECKTRCTPEKLSTRVCGLRAEKTSIGVLECGYLSVGTRKVARVGLVGPETGVILAALCWAVVAYGLR